MRRSLVLGILAALTIAALPAAVIAAPAQRVTEHAISIECGLSNDDGFVSAFAADSSVFGAFGDLAFWATPADPFNDQPTLVTIGAEVDSTDSSLSASFELIDVATEAAAGTAELVAVLSNPIGGPEPVSERFREGNRWTRIEGTVQAMEVTGTLTVPGAATFDLAGCFATIQDLTYFTTNPAAFVDRFDSVNLSCNWEIDGGFVGLFASADTFGAFSELFVSDASGNYVGFADATLSTRTFQATFDLFVDPNGQAVVGSASASATLARTGEVVRTMDGSGPNHAKFTSERLAVNGTLAVSTPDGDQTLPMDDEHCFASDDQAIVHSVRPAGPKPGPLANDAPEGAKALTFRKSVRVVTGGNAQAPEELCSFIDPETGDSFEFPIQYTAWWTFIGTGDPVTVDTAGSYFDTIVGVYTGSPGSLEQVGCVDDVFEPTFSLQARITVDTVAGTTYYVQAGGFGSSTGRLQIVVR